MNRTLLVLLVTVLLCATALGVAAILDDPDPAPPVTTVPLNPADR